MKHQYITVNIPKGTKYIDISFIRKKRKETGRVTQTYSIELFYISKSDVKEYALRLRIMDEKATAVLVAYLDYKEKQLGDEIISLED